MSDRSKIQSLSDAVRLYPLPGNRRAYLHQPCDYKTVVVRPDMKFQMHDAIGESYYRTAFGLVLLHDGRPVSFDFDRVEQSFELNCLPLLSQQVTQNGFRFVLESHTTVAAGRGVVMLRLTVWRCGKSPESVDIGWLAVRNIYQRFVSLDNDCYIVFEPWAPAWEKQLPLNAESNHLHDGQFVFCAYRFSGGVKIIKPGSDRCVSQAFRVSPQRDEPETIEFLVPYECYSRPADAEDRNTDFHPDRAFRITELEQLLSLSFVEERSRQVQQWASQLARATKISMPETYVQDVYRTLTLNNLQFLGGSTETSQLRPGQGGLNDFAVVYAWEASHFLSAMARQGFHDEIPHVLDFLLTTQDTSPPRGEVSDADGCFRPFIHWMNETGAVLRIFADYAFACGDFERLKRDSAALLKAARWIQRQRNLMKKPQPGSSKKPLHYGLMPKGCPHDWPVNGHFLFTDTYIWQGLNALAKAFESAGLPDAAWLREEADDYRKCILDAVRQAIKPHPHDPAAKWVPCELYEDPAEAIKTSVFCGPLSLLGSGILDAGDELIPTIEASLRASKCLSDRFAFKMRLMEQENLRQAQLASAGGHADLYYVTVSESNWHRVWLQRGEREKAMAFFYMTMAYAISRDLHMAHERYCPQLPWLIPWQPNASGNGRIIDMIIANLCMTVGGDCLLLHGVPDAWFQTGQPLGIDGLWVNGGRCSFSVEPCGSGEWNFSYSFCESNLPERFIIALPDDKGGRALIEIPTGGESVRSCRVKA